MQEDHGEPRDEIRPGDPRATHLARPGSDGLYDGDGLPWLHPEVYHAIEGRTSRGELVHARTSLHEYRYWRDHPQREATPAMIRGDAVHAAIMEPDRFFEEYALEPDFGPKNRKEPKARFEEWLATEAVGKKVVPKAEARGVTETAIAIRSRPQVNELLSGPGLTEPSVLWSEESDGEPMRFRCRPDRIIYTPSGEPIVIDLKGMQRTDPESFEREMVKGSMHLQAAFYLRGLTELTGTEHRRWIWIAWQAVEPYAGGIYEIDEESLDIGAREVESLIRKVAAAETDGEFPDHSEQIHTAGLPDWYKRRAEDA